MTRHRLDLEIDAERIAAIVGHELDDFPVRIALKVGEQRHMIIEERLKLFVRPRPRWMPGPVYRWIVARVVIVEWRRKP